VCVRPAYPRTQKERVQICKEQNRRNPKRIGFSNIVGSRCAPNPRTAERPGSS
jgi:hypothetical protein